MSINEAELCGMGDRSFSDLIAGKLPDWREFDEFWEVIAASEILAYRALGALTTLGTNVNAQLANANDGGPSSGDMEWRRKARSFYSMVKMRRERLKTTVHVHSQHGDRVNKAWRDLTKRLIIAIAEHRLDVEESGKRARSVDVILWDSLDELSFPNGGPLSALADVHIAKRDREYDAAHGVITGHAAPARNRGADSFRPLPI